MKNEKLLYDSGTSAIMYDTEEMLEVEAICNGFDNVEEMLEAVKCDKEDFLRNWHILLIDDGGRWRFEFEGGECEADIEEITVEEFKSWFL